MIQQVRVKFNGEWFALAYNSVTQLWEGEIVPQSTSFHQPDGAYLLDVEAVNDSGKSAAADLQLMVNEREPPVITLVSPQEGYVTTKRPAITFTAVDESGGSGVSIQTLAIMLDGKKATGAASTDIANGYRITYTPAQPLSEGNHRIAVKISDFDGNTAYVSMLYTVDTLQPALFVAEPNYRSVVDDPAIKISGTATDVTWPVTVRVEQDDQPKVDIPVAPPRGEFSWECPLHVGGNHITVTAIDGVGWKTTKELFIIRLITGRTQEHVDALAALLAKPESEWTDEESKKFLAARCWGSYDYTDLNRVTMAMEHLADKFRSYGYDVSLVPAEPAPGRAQWQKEDYPTSELLAIYLANVERLRKLMDIPISLPKSVEGLDYKSANRIEAVLVALDSYAPYLNSMFYAGEVYSGEI